MSSRLSAIPLTLAAALEVELVIDAPEPVFELDELASDCVAPTG